VVEKRPETKKRPSHLRAVPTPVTPSFFDMLETEVSEAVVKTAVAATTPIRTTRTLAQMERSRLKTLLAELEGLKKGLKQARKH
jgi:hypothetical protein